MPSTTMRDQKPGDPESKFSLRLISGGGISADGTTWHPARRAFLLPIKALARMVPGKVRALLQKCPDLVVPDAVWRKPLDRPRHRLGKRRAGRA